MARSELAPVQIIAMLREAEVQLSVHNQAKLNAVARELNEQPRKTLG